jgi:alcohol dehydrogenase, propanol-preferring
VVAIGIGGLGHVAVQLLRALCASRVVAVDARPEAVELALRCGAHAALPAADASPEAVRAETGAAGASLVLDFVGKDETLALAARVVAVGGEMTVIGVGGGTLAFGFGAVPLECSISAPNWGTRPELFEVVGLACSGAIDTEIQRFSLDDALEAYRRLHDGQLLGRGVVLPNG